MIKLVAVALVASTISLPTSSVAQEETIDAVLKVYLDCQFECDFDHLRREVTFVNYVRNRQDADVHVLVTSQTAAGGREFTMAFIGLDELSAIVDTLVFVSSAIDSDTERRDDIVQRIQSGLMRFVAETPLINDISISYSAEAHGQTEPEEDPWNAWVFRISAGGNANGEDQSSSFSVNGTLSAERTTEAWKLEIFSSGRFAEDRFDLSDGSEFVSDSKNFFNSILLVRSLSDHWSAGGQVNVSSSTFVNEDLSIKVAPAIEYNIFPYAESTRRQLSILYSVGVQWFNYEERTIFGKDTELRPSQNLSADYEVSQPWGRLGLGVEVSSFLHDLARHRVDLRGDFSVRLFRGFEVTFFGSASRVKNQLFLSAEGIPDDEILVQRRQLGTNFRYFGFISLSYTFGSVFNNVVNPRMEQSFF